MHILWWLIVGLISGWAAGEIMTGARYGVLGDFGISTVGAMMGGFVMRWMGYDGDGGLPYTIGGAIAGAVMMSAVFRLLTGRAVRA